MKFRWLGLQDYSLIFNQQRETLKWPSEQEELWGLEHPWVLTLGRRARAEEEISQLCRDIPVVETDRGGLATLHGPGQLVIYPLLSLRRRQWGPRDYVCCLLQVTRTLLESYGLKPVIDDSQSGLYIEGRKICFVGLRVTGGRSYHGLSLNVNNDLTPFDLIRSCGVSRRPMITLRELGINGTTEEVFQGWVDVAKKTKIVYTDASMSTPERACGVRAEDQSDTVP